MTEPAKDKKKEGKKKYYFGIVPKEEFPKFMERLNAELKKTENKKGDKKMKKIKNNLNMLKLNVNENNKKENKNNKVNKAIKKQNIIKQFFLDDSENIEPYLYLENKLIMKKKI